jgi:hypothetical protein
MKLRRRRALPVGLEAIERELLDKCGSVSAAARALGVSSVDLRRLVTKELASAVIAWAYRRAALLVDCEIPGGAHFLPADPVWPPYHASVRTGAGGPSRLARARRSWH